VRSITERKQVAALAADGLNDCEISRQTGIPRGTVRDWRRQPEPAARAARWSPPSIEALPASAYAYLLGIYLGDGYLAPPVRGVHQLRVYLDDRYPSIVGECVRTIESIFPRQRANVQHHATSKMCLVTLYSKHWEMLLPQHGPGMKHNRPIVLAEWQREIVEREPGQFLRGLIHSDGWRGMNRVRSPAGKEYAYPQYQFCNRSEDILGLFTWACELLGVKWRRIKRDTISVARRDSVAILDEFVGPKR
jgi:Homeodomain-like domain-containing protein